MTWSIFEKFLLGANFRAVSRSVQVIRKFTFFCEKFKLNIKNYENQVLSSIPIWSIVDRSWIKKIIS